MKKYTFSSIIVLTIITASLSYAYIPTSYALINKLLKKFSFQGAILVEQEVYQKINDEINLVSNTDVAIKYPLSLRAIISSDDSKIKFIANDDDIVEISNSETISFNRSKELYFYELFSIDNVDNFFKYLDQTDIDSNKSTLGLNENVIC